MRRRLATGRGLPAEKYGWKPFGVADYGYPYLYQTASSWTIWALVTFGSFTVNPYEATALLAGGIYAAEKILPDEQTWGSGASWVHNLQAGYCWYHYFVKGRRGLPLLLGSYAEIAGDLGAIIEERIGDANYSHKAHYEGASIGMVVAFLLDMMWPKKGGHAPLWFKAIPFAVIATLLWADSVKSKSQQ